MLKTLGSPRIATGSSRAASNAMLAAGVSSLFLGAAMIIAGAGHGGSGLDLSFKWPQFRTAVQIDFSTFGWLANLRLKSDRAILPPDLQMPFPELDLLEDRLTQTIAVAERKQVAPIHLVKFKTRIARQSKRQPSFAPAPVIPVLSEAAKLQQLHQLLRNRFLIALNQMPMTTQSTVAQVITPAKRIVTSQRHRPKAVADSKAPARILASRDSQNIQAPQPRLPQQKTLSPNGAMNTLTHHRVEVRLPEAPLLIKTGVDQIQTSAAAENTTVATQPESQPPALTVKQETPPVASPELAATQGAQTSTHQTQDVTGEYSTLGIFGPLLAMNTQGAGPHVPLVNHPAVPTQKAPGVIPPAPPSGKAPSKSTPPAPHEYSLVSALNAVVPSTPAVSPKDCKRALAPVGTHVEAFDWSSPIDGADTAALTEENPDLCGSTIGWRFSRVPNYWPTLAWYSGANGAMARAVPILRNNTSLLLGQLAGATVQKGAGIVFGKVPAGWGVEFSGRSEGVVVLNAQNQPVAPGNLSGERYFAFLNAAPGAHLVFLTGGAAESAAVGIPVMDGVATYVDLTQLGHRAFGGVVLDGSADRTLGLSRIQVRVLGQPKAATVTQSDGAFTVPAMVTVGDYPIFVETEANSGYTHRYRILPDRTEGLSLFRLSKGQVDGWVGQLERGVSDQSGIVVGAVGKIVDAREDGTLFPVVRTLGPSSTLAPETYTLSPAGELEVQASLGPYATRFIGMQVPEGPSIAAVEDREQNRIWSELVFASPGVINMVGPY